MNLSEAKSILENNGFILFWNYWFRRSRRSKKLFKSISGTIHEILTGWNKLLRFNYGVKDGKLNFLLDFSEAIKRINHIRLNTKNTEQEENAEALLKDVEKSLNRMKQRCKYATEENDILYISVPVKEFNSQFALEVSKVLSDFFYSDEMSDNLDAIFKP